MPDLLPGDDRAFGAGVFVDMESLSYWLTNVRTCVTPQDWERLRHMITRRNVAPVRTALFRPGWRGRSGGPTTSGLVGSGSRSGPRGPGKFLVDRLRRGLSVLWLNTADLPVKGRASAIAYGDGQ